MSGLAITTVVLYGNWRIEEGLTTAGALFSFITAFILAFDPMRRNARSIHSFRRDWRRPSACSASDMKPAIVDNWRPSGNIRL